METIKKSNDINEKIRIHDLRRYFATFVMKSNIPNTVAKDILGHADINMTEYYQDDDIDNKLPRRRATGYSSVCPTKRNLFVHDISYDNVFLDFLHNFRFVFHFHSFQLYLQNNRPFQKLPPHNFLFTSGQFLNILFAVTLFIILAICAGAILGIDCIKKCT